MTAEIALAALLAVASPSSSPSVKQVFDSLERVRHFHDVAISRDGGSVAWSEKAKAADGSERMGRLFVASPAGAKPRRLTGGGGKDAREKSAAFSPDGSRIAFLSDAGAPGKTQIWVASVAGGAPKRLTNVKGQLAHPIWSPDGRSIAFLFVTGSQKDSSARVSQSRHSRP